ncbi:MAG TPA: DNA cytosine methyltransferase [Acidimicrobiales bacterium]|nr:DNA cytosine methyltransferase [Acidimicrobiales bacterium]
MDAAPVGVGVRDAARSLGGSLALDLDRFWGRACEGAPLIDVVDMFSGCGGMSAGFVATRSVLPSYRLVAAVDVDTVANVTYEANLGIPPSPESVAELAEHPARLKALLKEGGRREGVPLVLIGCAPCQGFSSHRNSAGQGDGRNPLFLDFARIAARLQPDFVVVENVPELLTSRYWPYVEAARGVLGDAGYFSHLSVHNMADYGVPQERFRALLLASRRPFSAPTGVLRRPEYRTVRDAIGALPPVAPGERRSDDPMHYTAGHRESTIRTIRLVPKDGGNRPPGSGPQCLRDIEIRQGKPGYEDIYGRLSWDKPSITITAYARNPASGRFVHPEQDRGLSVREAACLQGFPRSYLFGGTFDQRFQQIGNAVPPPFAAYLAMHILGELASADAEQPLLGRGIERPLGDSFSRLIPALKAGHRHEAELIAR